MCRFLLVRSAWPIQPAGVMAHFAQLCAERIAPDGHRQEDGWGIAWKENEAWRWHTSLKPVWEEQGLVAQLPSTRLFVAHARSAGFAEHKGILSHNQPYVDGSLCFVFNGMIRGVRLPIQTEGEIGAQKLFVLLRRALERRDGVDALRWLDHSVTRHSRHIVGMNIGLVQGDRFYLLCEYGEKPEYFGLNHFSSPELTIVCSEKLPGYNWRTMDKGQVLAL